MAVIILIVTNKLSRAISSLLGAVITYFVLIFIEKLDFSVVVDMLFGSPVDGFVNLHSIIMIIGMMIIVEIAHEAGSFQFIAAKLVKLSKGKPIPLFIIFCSVTVFISAILNNILTVIIMIPLTITVSRMLNISPTPYILTQAILVNIGGTIFSISSIPNILITTYANIEFIEFFLNIGLLSLIIFMFTLCFFISIYKNELKIPEEGKNVLREFNIWNVIQSKRLLYQSLISLIILLLLFILIPSFIIPPDLIALSIALILIIVTKLNPKEIISKIDFELIFYLLGIFIIVGGLEITGVTNVIGIFILNIGGTNFYVQLLLLIWFSAYLSSCIDNIPITKVLIPVADTMAESASLINKSKLFYGLIYGANWGDNLTPLGDNILVVNVAEQNKRPISFKSFFKLGFITTNYQLAIISIYYTLVFNSQIGFIILGIIVCMIVVIYLVHKFSSNKIKSKINRIATKLREIIIK
ncbi:MAG: SLC13 family permease [Promethearchaeota archaeon]|jgi:Na+/H+ antiporter NhaD/arsenite permease-like protein